MMDITVCPLCKIKAKDSLESSSKYSVVRCSHAKYGFYYRGVFAKKDISDFEIEIEYEPLRLTANKSLTLIHNSNSKRKIKLHHFVDIDWNVFTLKYFEEKINKLLDMATFS